MQGVKGKSMNHPIKTNLQRVAQPDNMSRRKAILDILKAMDCAFTIQKEGTQTLADDVENIIVHFGDSKPRLVLGAHYDTYPGSVGANDNAASVCILLRLIQDFIQNKANPTLDVVFFDKEEKGLLGSAVYLKQIQRQNIKAMINLELCGVGEVVLIGPKKGLTSALLDSVQLVNSKAPFQTRIIPRLPKSDQTTFIEANIPGLAVTIVPESDLDVVDAMAQGQPPPRKPAILDTIHGGPKDGVEFIQATAMTKVYEWIKLFISNNEP